MSKRMWTRGRLAVLAAVMVVALLALWGCGGGGYGNPTTAIKTTKTETALVTAGTLKTWTDEGLVNKKGGYDRVVILEITANANHYNTEHIPGAILVNMTSDIMASRVEGPAQFGQMVADGKQMDTLIQKAGIDENTTIVFTTSDTEITANAHYNMTRGYVTFRYWGFPKERLKVLDGGNKAWKALFTTNEDKEKYITSVVPTITPSSYVVTPDGVNRVQADLRASLADMITAVTAGGADFIDGRGAAGPTTDLIDGTKYAVFEGQVNGGRNYNYTNLVNGDKTFNLAADVRTKLALTTNTVYTMCRAGNIASTLFFLVDGYAYYDGSKKAVWYDGSWGQWGLLADTAAVGTTAANAGGKLPAGSPWATNALTQNIIWSVDVPRSVIDITSRLSVGGNVAADANQIEEQDKAYKSQISSGGGAGGNNGGGGC